MAPANVFRRLFQVWFIVILGLSSAGAAPPDRLPEFHSDRPADWINSKPLSRDQLKGKVVLLDVWTFECWNCYRSFPWLRQVEAKFAEEAFTVIGVHTPEFEHEKVRASIVAKAKEFGLHHPILIDNDFRYWKALNNRYWPAFYLIDKTGRIRHYFVGETHADTERSREVDAAIRVLLDE